VPTGNCLGPDPTSLEVEPHCQRHKRIRNSADAHRGAGSKLL